MTLEEAIEKLDTLDESLTICAGRAPEWTPHSEADVRPSEEVRPGGRLTYFLEVSVAKDVLRGWSYVRGGRVPNLAEKCEAIIYYAENDAYLLPEQTHQ